MYDEVLDISSCNRIAIMGGAFDPIHYGHLAAAEAVTHRLQADQVIFIPSGRPPHKNYGQTTPSEHRYLMTVLATATNPHFQVSRLEIDRPGLTYTIDTIKAIRRMLKPEAEIYFISGADAIHQIFSWKNPQELLTLCRFVAVTRPGFSKKSLLEHISKIEKLYQDGEQIQFVEVPALSISSSDIRARVLEGRPIKYLLPEEVERYIMKCGLYNKKPHEYDLDLMSVDRMLQNRLTEKRYRHTIGTAEEAVRLARHYGGPADKAYIAGLLHDCAKDFSQEEKRELCIKYNIPLDPVTDKQIDLTHGDLAAEISRHDYGIDDEDILNSIRYHTTGRKGMSLLEKIIYVADCIEPEREDYPGLTKIRRLAYQDINKAVKAGISSTIEENKNRGRLIHPLSIEALNEY